MAKQKQESMAGWQEQAKAYAKAERELRIERYLGTLTAYKAHITLLENEREEYIAKQRGMLFFDASTDQHLLRIAEKLMQKRQQVEELEQRIKGMVESRNKLKEAKQ